MDGWDMEIKFEDLEEEETDTMKECVQLLWKLLKQSSWIKGARKGWVKMTNHWRPNVDKKVTFHQRLNRISLWSHARQYLSTLVMSGQACPAGQARVMANKMQTSTKNKLVGLNTRQAPTILEINKIYKSMLHVHEIEWNNQGMNAELFYP